MIRKNALQVAIACALFATSLSTMAETHRLHYALHSTIPVKAGGGSVTPPVITPEPEPSIPPVITPEPEPVPEPTPEIQYNEAPLDTYLITGPGHRAVVSGNQGTYTSILPYRVLVTSVTFIDISGNGYESSPKIIAQGCSGSEGAYSCTLTVEARDDSGGFGDMSPWEAAETGVEGFIYVKGVTFVPKPAE